MNEQTRKGSGGFSSERLNLLLAVCAILISAASFYATYLQADAAERQVKAATWPWLQFSTGNYDVEKQQFIISMTITNNGVGPAQIKQLKLNYHGQEISSISQFMRDCCLSDKSQDKKLAMGPVVTSPANNSIVAAGEKINLLQVIKGDNNSEFWDKLNDERFKLKMTVCYCSLLDKCYISNQSDTKVTPVEQCPGDDIGRHDG